MSSTQFFIHYSTVEWNWGELKGGGGCAGIRTPIRQSLEYVFIHVRVRRIPGG